MQANKNSLIGSKDYVKVESPELMKSDFLLTRESAGKKQWGQRKSRHAKRDSPNLPWRCDRFGNVKRKMTNYETFRRVPKIRQVGGRPALCVSRRNAETRSRISKTGGCESQSPRAEAWHQTPKRKAVTPPSASPTLPLKSQLPVFCPPSPSVPRRSAACRRSASRAG